MNPDGKKVILFAVGTSMSAAKIAGIEALDVKVITSWDEMKKLLD